MFDCPIVFLTIYVIYVNQPQIYKAQVEGRPKDLRLTIPKSTLI